MDDSRTDAKRQGIRPELLVFLDDPRVPIHNNDTERALRNADCLYADSRAASRVSRSASTHVREVAEFGV